MYCSLQYNLRNIESLSLKTEVSQIIVLYNYYCQCVKYGVHVLAVVQTANTVYTYNSINMYIYYRKSGNLCL